MQTMGKGYGKLYSWMQLGSLPLTLCLEEGKGVKCQASGSARAKQQSSCKKMQEIGGGVEDSKLAGTDNEHNSKCQSKKNLKTKITSKPRL